MPDFISLPLTVKLSGLLVGGGLIVFAIGFATHFWSYSEVYGYATEGLWLGCYKSECREIFHYGPLPTWFIATLVFECLGLLAAISAMGLTGLYIFSPSIRKRKNACILPILASFAASGSIILGIIIYGANVLSHLSWSFAFCTIGGISYGIAGVLLIIAMVTTTRKEQEPDSNPAHPATMSDMNPDPENQPLKA